MEGGKEVGARAKTRSDRLFYTASQRRALSFFVVDVDGNVIVNSHDVDIESVWPRLRPLITEHLRHRNVAPDSPTFFPLDETTVLRITQVAAPNQVCFAIFFDDLERRKSSIASVAGRYALTNRERDVLKLLLQSLNTSTIAGRLFIAESTVVGHIKSLFRKTQTSKRSELLAKVFDLDVHD